MYVPMNATFFFRYPHFHSHSTYTLVPMRISHGPEKQSWQVPLFAEDSRAAGMMEGAVPSAQTKRKVESSCNW